MPQHGFGNTDGLTYEPFQPCAEGEMFPFNCLRRGFADGMLYGFEMTIIHICPIRIEMLNAQWGSQRFSLSEAIVLMVPHHIRHYEARAMINGMPEPSLWRVLLDNAPHFVTCCCFHFLDLHDDFIGLHLLDG